MSLQPSAIGDIPARTVDFFTVDIIRSLALDELE
jgi:hypothetical protein